MNCDQFSRRALPYLKSEYFNNPGERLVFDTIRAFIAEYNARPNGEVLAVEIGKNVGVAQPTFETAVDCVEEISKQSAHDNQEWLMDAAEEFCQDRAIALGLRQSVKILEGDIEKNSNLSKGSIPQILSDALAVSFDSRIGHDFLEDYLARFESYKSTQSRIPFGVDILNKITKGGVYRKTLSVLLAGTGVGKSLAMCSMAADNLRDGLNVLYITMEMSEEQISKRIDANILDLSMDELEEVPLSTYQSRIDKAKAKIKGKLIVKEYPTSSAGAANFRHLLNELKLKKKFIPDIIYVDYINICASSKMKRANVNSYEYIKSIAEELRALMVEFNCAGFTATQLNREGFANSDPDLTHTSESFGLPATADLFLAIITSDELAKMGQFLFKQLKNRYRDENLDRTFVVGVNRNKMKLYNVAGSSPPGQQTTQQAMGKKPVNKDAGGFT